MAFNKDQNEKLGKILSTTQDSDEKAKLEEYFRFANNGLSNFGSSFRRAIQDILKKHGFDDSFHDEEIQI